MLITIATICLQRSRINLTNKAEFFFASILQLRNGRPRTSQATCPKSVSTWRREDLNPGLCAGVGNTRSSPLCPIVTAAVLSIVHSFLPSVNISQTSSSSLQQHLFYSSIHVPAVLYNLAGFEYHNVELELFVCMQCMATERFYAKKLNYGIHALGRFSGGNHASSPVRKK